MKTSDLKLFHTYIHRTRPDVTIVGYHPHDGAARIGMYYDVTEDEDVYLLVVADDFIKEVEEKRPAVTPLHYPSDFNLQLQIILGHLCFQLGKFAGQYRVRGADIAPKAEAEQAFMLDKMLRMYMMHGAENWIEELNKDMLGADYKAKGEINAG